MQDNLMNPMKNLYNKFQRFLIMQGRPSEINYEIMQMKKKALFWGIVNILGIILVSGILLLTPYGILGIKVMISFFFLSNLLFHLYIIYRDPKAIREEMVGDAMLSREIERKVFTHFKRTQPAKYKPANSPEHSSEINEFDSSYLLASPMFFDKTESELISIYFTFEVGVLITPKGVVIKQCRCSIRNHKCRLCPFRAYPLTYYKTWFWEMSNLPNEVCPYCGVCFLANEVEYERLLKTSYPLHDCICKCKYCKYAIDQPLKARPNLVPDNKHCSCICRQCRSIEDIIHGLQPLEDERRFRFNKIPYYGFSSDRFNFSHFSHESSSSQKVTKSRVPTPFISLQDCRNLRIHNDLWRRFGINPYNLVTWITNLRIWISNTILKRIVNEIATIDRGLQSHSLPLISVGQVGFDILRATAYSEQIARNVPSLAKMLPFLEICPNQQFIVQRIRELAVGNTMREFSEQSRDDSNDSMWSRQVPSDSELVMHLVISYFDAMLPPLYNEPGRRPFTTVYFAKAPEMPPQMEIAIYQQSTTPPLYQVIVNEKIHKIPSGLNNIFFTLLLFTHCVKVFHHSTIGRANLGPSGLNMLWIIEDTI